MEFFSHRSLPALFNEKLKKYENGKHNLMIGFTFSDEVNELLIFML